MDLMNLSVILAEAAPPAGTQPNQTGALLQMLVTFGLFGAIFYFIILRPQQKRQREQNEMLKSVKAGDKILTSGGLIATVVSLKEKSLSIRSADSKMEITRSAIAEILERSGESGES